jgi:predicted ATPase
VFVAGEVGIGKTTFVSAFLDRFASGATRVSRGQCIEQYGAGEPYMPVQEALIRLCRQPNGEHIVEMLRELAPAWLAQMPCLLSGTDREGLQVVVQDTGQRRMLLEMAQALEAIAAETPLIIALEDLHWADHSTLELISVIARRTEPARLLILGTYRPTEMLASDHPLCAMKQELELHRHCKEMRLKLLSETDVAAYLARRFADDDRVQALVHAAPAIHQRTDGNPLFMVNMVDYLADQGSMLDPNKVETPHSILQLIERNFERLNPVEQRVLEAASVVGAEFSAAAVGAALELAVSEIEACCSRLSRHEQFVSAHGISEWPDGTIASRFRFHHALFGEVLYQRIPAGHRGSLHRLIAEREEQAHGERADEIAAELANHYVRGADSVKAVKYLRLAGVQAGARAAHQEAISLFKKALELLPKQLSKDDEQCCILLWRSLRSNTGLANRFNPAKRCCAPRIRHSCWVRQKLSPTPLSG